MTAALSFLGGLTLLIVAGDLVVRSAATIGRHFGLSPMVIGLTIVAGGTSAPELAVVFQAIGAGDTELAAGSIVGSNIANVLLVLGTAAVIGTIHVASRVVRTDVPIMIVVSSAFLLLALDGNLGRIDGAILLVSLGVFIWWTFRNAGAADTGASPDDEGEPADTEPPRASRRLLRPVVEIVGGVLGLVIAARFVVSGAEEIALGLGVPELIVGLTIVALGTSAPEIVTTIVAAVKGQREVAVGNAVGSNVFNILLVLGAAGAVSADGISLSDDLVQLDLPIMVAAAVACLPLVAWDRKLDRWEGAMFLAFYIAYLTFLALDATGHRAKDPFALVMVGFVLPLAGATVATIAVRQRRALRAKRQNERRPQESQG